MAVDNELKVVMSGDNTSLMSAVTQATDKINGFAKESSKSINGMDNPLKSLTSTFDSFKGVTLGAAGAATVAAVAIGAMFKYGSDAVNTTVEFGKEMKTLHKFMGGTSEQAGELAMSLFRIGVSAEEFIGYMTKEQKSMDKVILNHKDLKTALLNEDGTYKSMADTHKVLIEKYLSFADAGDRARFAIEAWGKSGPKAVEVMEKQAKALENNRILLQGMGVDYGQVEAKTIEFLKAQGDLKVINEAQALQVGSVLLPIWTNFQMSMGKMASSEMPAITTVFQIFASVIIVAIGLMKNAFLMLKTIVEGIVLTFGVLVMAGMEAIQGNLKAAGTVLKDGLKDVDAKGSENLKNIKKNAIETGEALAAVWNPKKSGAPDPTETKSNTRPKDKESALEKVRARLEAAKARYEMEGLYELDAHGNILKKKAEADQVNRVFTKEMESKFLQEQLATFDGTEKDKQKLTTMRFAADREVLKQEWTAKLQNIDNQIKAEKASNEAAIDLAKDKANKILAYEGGNKNSADYQKALGEVAALEKKAADHIRDIKIARDEIVLESFLFEKDAEIKAIQHTIEMGDISEITGLRKIQQIEDTKYKIQKEALEKRLALRKLEGAEGEKEAVKIEAELVKLNASANAKKVETETKTQKIIKDGWATLFAGVKTELNKSIQGMILGTLTLKNAITNIWGSIKQAFAQMAADQIMIWLGMEKTKTAATQESAAERLAIEAWSSIKKVAIYIWEGIKYVAIQAWKAAAGAYNAIVGIPVVGPFLAPVAAAVALAAVIKMVGSIASARKGFDIAAGDNPMTQLHEKEMVLPAEHADTIRSMKGNNFGDIGKAIIASNQAIHKTINASQNKVDKYNSSNRGNVTNQNGHTINVSGFVGSERQLATHIKNILNNDSRIYGSA